MSRRVQPRWIGAGLGLLGVVGVSAAVTAVLTALPAPAAGGTCGPGRSSETALAAFLNPGSIGAGSPPPTANVAAHAQWLAFVGECQAATSSRILGAFAILVLALCVAVAGLVLYRRAARRRDDSGEAGAQPPGSSPPSATDHWWESQTLGSGSPAPLQPPFADPVTAEIPAGEPRPAEVPAGDPPGAGTPGTGQRISTSSR